MTMTQQPEVGTTEMTQAETQAQESHAQESHASEQPAQQAQPTLASEPLEVSVPETQPQPQEHAAESIQVSVAEPQPVVETAPQVVETAPRVVETAPQVVETAPQVVETAQQIETQPVVAAAMQPEAKPTPAAEQLPQPQGEAAPPAAKPYQPIPSMQSRFAAAHTASARAEKLRYQGPETRPVETRTAVEDRPQAESRPPMEARPQLESRLQESRLQESRPQESRPQVSSRPAERHSAPAPAQRAQAVQGEIKYATYSKSEVDYMLKQQAESILTALSGKVAAQQRTFQEAVAAQEKTFNKTADNFVVQFDAARVKIESTAKSLQDNTHREIEEFHKTLEKELENHRTQINKTVLPVARVLEGKNVSQPKEGKQQSVPPKAQAALTAGQSRLEKLIYLTMLLAAASAVMSAIALFHIR